MDKEKWLRLKVEHVENMLNVECSERETRMFKCFKWVFPEIGVPPNGWVIMENPIKMDDLGVPLFLETPKCIFFQKAQVDSMGEWSTPALHCAIRCVWT